MSLEPTDDDVIHCNLYIWGDKSITVISPDGSWGVYNVGGTAKAKFCDIDYLTEKELAVRHHTLGVFSVKWGISYKVNASGVFSLTTGESHPVFSTRIEKQPCRIHMYY